MVGLKRKVRGATLMETVIATVIILAVFVVASLIITNTYKGVVQRDTFIVENRIEELFYLVSHNAVSLPYEESFGNYEIYMNIDQIDEIKYIRTEISQREYKKSLIRHHVHP